MKGGKNSRYESERVEQLTVVKRLFVLQDETGDVGVPQGHLERNDLSCYAKEEHEIDIRGEAC